MDVARGLERRVLRALDGVPVAGASQGPAAQEHGMELLLALGVGRNHRAHLPCPLAACRIPVWAEIGETVWHAAVPSVQPRPGFPAALGRQGLAAGRRRGAFCGGGGGSGAAGRLGRAADPRR